MHMVAPNDEVIVAAILQSPFSTRKRERAERR
jgi:hypothetical protein